MRVPKSVRMAAFVILLLISVIWLIPDIYVLFQTFTIGHLQPDLSIRWEFTLKNLLLALQVPNLGRQFLNSVIVTFSTVVLVTIFGALAAYAISRLSFRGRMVFYACLLLTMMIPGTILAIPLFVIVKTLHLFNNYLGLILPYTALGIPLALVILKNFFDSFPRELEEAALIDGAGILRIFLTIVLPSTVNSLTVVMIWTFLGAWNEFFLALMFATDDSMKTIALAPLAVRGTYDSNVNLTMGILVLISIPTVILYLVLQRQLEQSVQGGALKG